MIGVVAPPLLTLQQKPEELAHVSSIPVDLKGTYRACLMFGVVRTSSVAHVVTTQRRRVRCADGRRRWWCFIAAVTNLVYIVRSGVDVILCDRSPISMRTRSFSRTKLMRFAHREGTIRRHRDRVVRVKHTDNAHRPPRRIGRKRPPEFQGEGLR